MRWRVDLALVFVAFVWGTTFVLVKQALSDVSTLLFLTLRFGIASFALAILLRREHRPALGRSIRAGMLAGLFLFAGYVLQTFGLKYTSPAKTGFLTGLYIPLVPVLGAMVYRRLPQLSEAAGIACAFAGMMLMTFQREITTIAVGDMLVILCAVAYAFHILVLGHFAPGSSAEIVSLVQIATAGVLSALSFWWAEPIHITWSPAVWVAIAVTSLLATALAFSIQTWAQQRTSPTRTALIFALEPLFAWATSYVVAGEVLGLRGIIGAVLILAGIIFVEL